MNDAPESTQLLTRRIGRGMLWSQGGRIAEVAITFGTAVIVVRELTPTPYGAYALLTNLAGAASVFIPVVTTDSLGALLPRMATRDERLFMLLAVAALRATAVIVATGIAFFAWGFLASAIGLSGTPRILLVLTGVYWIAQDLLNTVVGYYGAEIDMRPVAVWRAAGLSATFFAVVALAAARQISPEHVLAVVATGYAVALIGLVVGLRARGRPTRPPQAELRYAFGLTRHIWLVGVLSFTLATQIDVLLIGALTHDRRQAAFYAAAVGVVWRVQLLLVQGWGYLLVPMFGHAFATGGLPRVRRAWRSTAQVWLLVALPMNALLLANAPDVLGLLFGSPYLIASRLLQVICGFNLATALLVNPTCVAALWATDRQKVLARFRFVSASLNVVLALALIPPYGAMGAAIATGIAALGGGAIEYGLSRRLGANAYPVRLALVTSFATGCAMVPGFVINPVDALQLLLSGGLGVACFMGVLVIAKPLNQQDLVDAAALHPLLGGAAVRVFARG